MFLTHFSDLVPLTDSNTHPTSLSYNCISVLDPPTTETQLIDTLTHLRDSDHKPHFVKGDSDTEQELVAKFK